MTRSTLFALTVAACLALTTPVARADRTAGQHVDDTTIATSTKTALAEADLGSAGAINVEVYKGVVQLAGFVRSNEDRNAALAVAGNVAGVTDVLDAMVVMQGKRTAGQTLDDATIQTRLKAALAGSEGVGEAMAINTEVRKGEVILSGFVADGKVRSQAGTLAAGVPGVAKVHNQIAVVP